MTTPRIFLSSKFQAAASASALAFLPVMFDLVRHAPVDQIQSDTTHFVEAVGFAWSAAILGTAHEDAMKGGKQPAQPATQVNAGSGSSNVQDNQSAADPISKPLATATTAQMTASASSQWHNPQHKA